MKPITRLLPLFLLLAAAPASGADTAVSLTIIPPSGQIRLADTFKFKVEAALPENYSVRPDTAAGGPEFETLSFTKSKVSKKNGRKTETFEIQAQAFALGVSTFPPIAWRLAGDGVPGNAEILSSSFTLEILPLFETKEGEGIRDIYPPFRYISWLWLLALALAAAGAYYYFRGRKPGGAGVVQRGAWTDSRTPYLRARDRLEKLERSPLAAAGKLKEFYTGLASVLRLYLAEEFSIDASQMTTAVLSRELKRTGADIRTALKTRELLKKSDLVKFARLKPEDSAGDARGLAELLMEFHRAAEAARELAAAAEEQKRMAQPGGKP